MNKDGCNHPGLILANKDGDFSDEDVRVYICLNCGFPLLAAPVRKFKNNPEAKKFFEKIASEIELPKLG